MEGRLRTLGKKFKQETAVYRLVIKDSRTPRISKWLLALAIAYALMPFDLIPDFIPVIGLLDDAVILPLLVWLAVRLIPRAVIADCHSQVLNAE